MTNKRLLSIDWIKGVMILIIVLYHSSFSSGFRGYLGVDVFFYISGYFLMSSYLRKPTTAIKYTWNRIKQIAAPFIICILLAGGIQLAKFLANGGSFDSLVDTTGKIFTASLFASEFGGEFTREYSFILYWFLSVLIISSFILYALLHYNERLSTTVLFPIIVLLGYNALFCNGPSLDTYARIGPLGAPLVRGIVEMAAGAMICHIYIHNKTSIEKRSILINILGIVSFILFFALLFTKEALDKYTIIATPWILLSTVMDQSWLNIVLCKIKGGLLARLGRYTLYVYCIHGPVQPRVHWFNDHFLHNSLSGVGLFIVELFAVAIASVVLYYLSQLINRKVFIHENQPDHTRL